MKESDYIIKSPKGLFFVYGAIFLLIFGCGIVFEDTGGTYHALRMCLLALILLVPVVYGHRTINEYRYQIFLGVLVFALAVHINTVYLQSNNFRMMAACVALAIFARAFLFFRGYTLKTPQLIAVILMCVSTVVAIFSKMGMEWLIVIPYMLILIFTCWQGINLYFIKRSKGFFMILLASICALLYHIIGGFNFYYFNNETLTFVIQILHWFMLLFLVHSTTYPMKEFNRVKKRMVRKKPIIPKG